MGLKGVTTMTSKRILSMLLILALMLSVCPVEVFAAGNASTTSRSYTSEIITNPLYPFLDEALAGDQLYSEITPQTDAEDIQPVTEEEASKTLRDAMVERETEVTIKIIPEDGTPDFEEKIFPMAYSEDYADSALSGDYLRWSWKGYGYKWIFNGTYYTITFQISYYTTAEQEIIFQTRLDTVLTDLKLDEKPVYQQLTAIYDYIADHVDYDYDALARINAKEPEEDDELVYTAYGALCEGDAVCQGYACLFYAMCRSAEIPVRVIASDDHSWNITELRDLWYNMDVTWDGQGTVSYRNYFLKGSASFANHTPKAEFLTDSFLAAYPISGADYSPVEADLCSNHVYDSGTKTVAATCTETGEITYTCSVCGVTKTESTDVLGHRASEIIVSPTCTEDGYIGRKCIRCDYYYIEEDLIAPGHSYSTSTVSSTCTSVGYTLHTCSRCGDAYTTGETAALGHNWNSGTITKAATEETEGEKVYTCSRCKQTKTEVIPVITHNYDSGVTTKTATCSEEGILTYTCTDTGCDKTYTETIPPLGHGYTSVTTAPTCTEQGYTTYLCSACGDSYVDSYTASTGHSWDEGSTTKDATETQDGEKLYTCTTCGDTKTDVIPAIVHTYDDGVITTAPTCIATGIRTYTCSHCDKTYTEVIPKTDHAYQSQVTEPTCTTAGYTTHTCSQCKDSYQDSETAALGHTKVTDAAVDATCTETGLTAGSHCSICGTILDAQETTAALGHSYTSTTTAPTCTEQGYTTYLCAACGDSYVDSYTASTGHSWDEGSIAKDATETQDGEKTYTCETCGETKTEIIPATIHSFNEGTVTKAPSCTEEGQRLYACTHCDKTYTVSIPKTDHRYVISVTDPTCTAMGYTTHTCYDCGDHYQDSFTAVLDHSYDDGRVTAAPTCITTGSRLYTCTGCGGTKTETIPVIAHQYTSYVEKTATCTEAGVLRYTCTTPGCGDTYWDAIPARTGGHRHEKQTIAPTCTEMGAIIAVCKYCGDSYTEEDIPALGHSYSFTVTAPTCTQDGKQVETCSRCGDTKITILPALGHSYISTVTAPTCITEGYTTHTCSVCGHSYTDSRTDFAGHTYETIVTEPTCTEQGYATHKCAFCGYSYTDSPVPITDHSYNKGIVTQAAGYLTPGVKTFTCTHCGIQKTASIGTLPVPFTDVDAAQFYYTPMLWALDLGITMGMTETTFLPDGPCTRAQVVTFLWRAAGCPEPTITTCPFTDVDENQFYYKAMLWAVEKEITNGTTLTTFSPDDTCTRSQVVTFLWRASGKPAAELTPHQFTDICSTAYYHDAMLWAVENNITHGMTATTFVPDGTCTRSQVVTFLYRCFG